jgi:hypothetical protein
LETGDHRTIDASVGWLGSFFRIHMFHGLTSQRLLALFVLGFLALNFPLLGLWDVDASVMGLPLFPTALMVLWTLLILVLAGLMERVAPDAKDD